jgi:hypothetical protein
MAKSEVNMLFVFQNCENTIFFYTCNTNPYVEFKATLVYPVLDIHYQLSKRINNKK